MKYFFGEYAPKDEVKAMEWLKKAAKGGDVRAQQQLGEMYFEGRGAKKDEKEALKWFRTAAKKEYPPAQEAVQRLMPKNQRHTLSN